MKKYIQPVSLLSFIAIACVGCGAGGTPAQAVDEQKLLQKASFDHDCPEDQIHIEKRHNVGETEGFVLEVCGKQAKYEGRDGGYHQVEVGAAPSEAPAAEAHE